MAYKANYRPIEVLTPDGWCLLGEDQRLAAR
jgi:arginyl-tRNA--protein-N-Asp/Glu arginylyltransferase